MTSQDFKKIEKRLPETSGVYFFISKKDKKEEILYIGKATNLRDRVKSYFSKDIAFSRGPKILKMLEISDDIKFEKTDSVLEALLLENFLIKKHQPPYNTKEKDDKSYNFVVITDEDFPRVLLVRGRDILDSKLNGDKLGFKIKESFGPFPFGSNIKDGLKIIRKIFPFRDKCTPNTIKPCFNRQIGLCPGVCTGEISKKEYFLIIKNISQFFKGQKKQILKDLQKQMNDFSKLKEFEKASVIKKRIFAINHIQDVSMIKSQTASGDDDFMIESYDISHTSGASVVGVCVVVSNGFPDKSLYKKFKIKKDENNDLKCLEEILRRRLKHSEWKLPNLFVVDGGLNQKKLFENILKENGLDIRVVSVVKDEKHNPKDILGLEGLEKYKKDILLSNSEAHRFAVSYHNKIRFSLK
jgi:excinuclease ABC subunit C